MRKILTSILCIISISLLAQNPAGSNAKTNTHFKGPTIHDSVITMIGFRAAQRPIPAVQGSYYYDLDSNAIIYYNNTAWGRVAPIGGVGTQGFQSVLSISPTLNQDNTVALSTHRFIYQNGQVVFDSLRSSSVTKSFIQKTIVFFGDSYTAGSGASTTAFRFSTRLSNMFGYTESNFGLGGSFMQNGTPSNPSGAANMVSRINLIPTYNSSTSAYLVFTYCYNDVNYNSGNYTAANMKSDFSNVIDSCTINRGWPANKIVLVPNVFNPLSSLYQRETDYRDSVQHLATTKGCRFVDMLTAFRTNDSTILIGPDATHPTDEGHLFMAQIIYRTITDTIVNNNQEIAANGLVEFKRVKITGIDTITNTSRVLGIDQFGNLGAFNANKVPIDNGMYFPGSYNLATRGKGSFGGFVFNGDYESLLVQNGVKADYFRATGTPTTPSLLSGKGVEIEILSGTTGYIQSYDRTGGAAINMTVNPFGGNLMLGSQTDNTLAKLQITGKLTIATIDSVNTPLNILWSDPSTGLVRKAAFPSTGSDSAIWKNNGTMTASHTLTGAAKSLYFSSLDSFNVTVNRMSLTGAFFENVQGLSDANQTLTAGTTQVYEANTITANRTLTMGTEGGRVIKLIVGNDNAFNWLPPASTVHDASGNNITTFKNNTTYTMLGNASGDWFITSVSSVDRLVETSASTLTLGSASDYVFTGSTTTWTLRTLSQSGGVRYHLKNAGSGNITLNAGGSDHLYDVSQVTTITVGPGVARDVVAGTTNWYIE